MMKKSSIDSVVLDEAVARLIGLTYIPHGFTLNALTAAFIESAEVQLHNAKVVGHQGAELGVLKRRVKVCQARHQLAEELQESLLSELAIEGSELLSRNSQSPVTLLDWDAVQDWAEENYGISGLYQPLVTVPEPGTKVHAETSASGTSGIPPEGKSSQPLATSSRFTEDEETSEATGKSINKLVGRGLQIRKAKNLLVTFNFLLNKFVDKHPQRHVFYTGSTQRLVVSELAVELENVIREELEPATSVGQGREAIKDRIEAALDAWALAKQKL